MIGQNGMGNIEELAQRMKALAGNMQQQGMPMQTVGGPPGRSMYPGAGGPFSKGDIGTPGTVDRDTGEPSQWQTPGDQSPNTPLRGMGNAGMAAPGGQEEMVQVTDDRGMSKQIPRSMHEKWVYGDQATRAKIESMNPVNAR